MAYRLADYLEEHGRRVRRPCIPPEDFWKAAARYAALGDLPAVASAAEDRGLLRDAARLRKSAGAQGDAGEAAALIQTWYSLYPHSADPRPAQWAVVHADLRNPAAVATMLDALVEAGAQEQVDALIASDPAVHADLQRTDAVAELLTALWRAGAQEQVDALAARAAAHIELREPFDPLTLVVALLVGRSMNQCIAAAAQVDLHDPRAVLGVLDDLRMVGAQEQIDALIARDPAAHADLRHRHAGVLLDALVRGRAQDQADALAARAPAARVDLRDPFAVGWLLYALPEAGAQEQADELVARDPAAHAALNDLDDIVVLLDALRRAGAQKQVRALGVRVAAQAELEDPFAVTLVLELLREAGAKEQATGLVERLPAQGLFYLFREEADNQVRFRFGCEFDGSPALPWHWDDLD